jgi:hypothetical protein
MVGNMKPHDSFILKDRLAYYNLCHVVSTLSVNLLAITDHLFGNLR